MQGILYRSLQINHVHQLYPALIDGMIVVVGEKVLDQMVPAKAAGFIKRDGGGAVSGTHLQNGIYCHCQFVLMACTQLSHR